MGPENSNTPVLFVHIDGVNYGLIESLGRIENIELDQETRVEPGSLICEMNLKPPYSLTLRIKRMSRKHVVKLLMSSGRSRNAANAIARTWGGHYASHFIGSVLTGEVI